MRTNDLLRISSRQLLRQYRKNIGVIITIILGTAGLIVMITMGKSIEDNISNDLELIGNATRLKVIFKQSSTAYLHDNSQNFSQTTIDSLRTIPGVEQVSSIVLRSGYVNLTFQNNISYFPLIGVDESFWKVHNSTAQSGVLFSRDDLQQHRAVCVLGPRTAHEIFGPLDPTGQFVTIDSNLFQVIGILDVTSALNKNRHILLPITTAQDRIDSILPVNTLYIRCHSWNDVISVRAKVLAMIRTYQPNDTVEVIFSKEILAKVKAIAFGVKGVVQLALIATFVLGGIGIWNIMMMAVRSRTREIGLKKAIGAEDHDILYQFLAESLMLSSTATLIGFLVGWTGVTITASILHNPVPTDLFWLSTIIGFSFSFFLGIAAGLTPAIKASKMEVVTALRYE